MTPEERWAEMFQPFVEQINAAVAEEREACAKVAERGVQVFGQNEPIDTGRIWGSAMAADIARLIRARGEAPQHACGCHPGVSAEDCHNAKTSRCHTAGVLCYVCGCHYVKM